MPRPTLCILSLLLCGCATVPTGSDADTQVALHVGEEQPVHGAGVSLSFAQVDGDSRCPSDVTCVWAGNAIAVLGVRAGVGSPSPYRLNTTLDPRKVQPTGQQFEIRLDSLRPIPHSGQTIPQSQYVAYLTIVRRSGG